MGRVRIISGAFRGRRVDVPRGTRVRPTSDRVREALFSILGSLVAEARVLDAFAGSGALGLEALSRGASSVVFVEADPATVRLLRRNVTALGVEECTELVAGDAIRLLEQRRIRGEFDLIFSDPPYGTDLGGRLLTVVERQGALSARGRLVVEGSAKEPAAGETRGVLGLVGSRRYGGTRIDLYGRLDAT